MGVGVLFMLVQKPAQIENAEVSETDFNLYTNERLGFSILLPKLVDIWVYDKDWYKNGKSNQYKIITSPVTAFDDGSKSYVYISTLGKDFDEDGIITDQTFESVENSEYGKWKIEFVDVVDDGDIVDFGKKSYGEGCTVLKKTPFSNQEDVFDIEFKSVLENTNLEDDSCYFSYARHVVKYNLSLKKLVAWSAGQDVNFILGSTTDLDTDWSNVKVFDQTMIDSFKFLDKTSVDTSDWKTYRNEHVPIINSIFPQSGKTGTIITLKGKNLGGFESDLDAWIENKKGEIAYLGQFGQPITDQITAKIEEKVCKTNESYRGWSCKEYMTIVPGVYKIFAQPYGKESNKVLFEVTK